MTMTENMIAEIDDLKEKNRLLREALGFYADCTYHEIVNDGGDVARHILEETE